MPWYRIIVWYRYRDKPIQKAGGLRYYKVMDIDVVQQLAERRAKNVFWSNAVIEVEVQMLSRNCQAVLRHLRDMREKKGGSKVIRLWTDGKEG
jgi:hypothetical protein